MKELAPVYLLLALVFLLLMVHSWQFTRLCKHLNAAFLEIDRELKRERLKRDTR